MHLKELDANLIVVLDALLIDASVTRAAERLGRSPSAVSHALANLRHIFDDELFVRAGQRLAPTARAKDLAPTIHIIVSGLESLLRPTTPFNPGTQQRTFTLSCPEMAELYLLPPLRIKILKDAPNIELVRIGNNSADNFEELRQGRTDFALIEGEQPAEVADINWVTIAEDPYITIASKSFSQKDKKLTLKKFQSYNHIMVQQSGVKPCPLEQQLLKHKLPASQLFKVTSSLTGILLALELGSFVTVPALHAALISNHLSITEVTLPFAMPKMPIHLGWHRSFERDECHQWLRQHALHLLQKSDQTPTS